MYSALIRSSSKEFARPRFKRIGLSIFPRTFKSSKFCMFLAPTCMMSTSSKSGRCSALMISVTTGRPVAFFASKRRSRPCSWRPWNAYGEVLGLKAPPRRKAAPERFTSSATSVICSFVSMEQGPAMTWKLPPPIFLPQTSMTVSSGCMERFAFLYGSRILRTSSTTSLAFNQSSWIRLVSPMRPMREASVPSERWSLNPWFTSSVFKFSTFSLLAFLFKIMIIILFSFIWQV